MNSEEYWKSRELAHIADMKDAEVDYQKEIAAISEKAITRCQKEIEAFYGKYADAEGIDINTAKLKASNMDIRQFAAKAKEYVEEKDFSKEANEQLKLYNMTMKVNRLELLKSELALELVNMGNEYQSYMTDTLTEEAKAEATRQAGILGTTLDTLDAKNIDKIVNGSWKNATFSQRLWGNNVSLKNNLDSLLTSAVIAGKHPTALARDMQKQFNVTQYEAFRLMRTESARIQAAIATAAYEEDGVTEYEWVAEPTACEICKPLDGKTFKVKGAENGDPKHPLFPMHPCCRCAIIPVASSIVEKTEEKPKPKQEKVKTQKKAGLSKSEKDAVDYYVSGDGMYINHYLRDPEKTAKESGPLTEQDKNLIKDLKKATNRKQPIKTLYRSVDASAIFGDITESVWEGIRSKLIYNVNDATTKKAAALLEQAAGKTVTEKGFMSTTKDLGLALDFDDFTGAEHPIVLELTEADKAKGIDIGAALPDLEKKMEQQEVLLHTDTTYKILDIGVKVDEYGSKSIYVKTKITK